MRHIILALLLLCAGCATHEVPAQYRPLEKIVQRPGGKATTITTIGTRAYVSDLDAWLQRHEPGSATYHAILTHEATHSRRQIAAGVGGWVADYLHDTDFMWREEQIGWYYELTELRKAGLQINVDGVAKSLAGYRNLRGSMVDFQTARAWVLDVLAGRWKPE